MFLCVIFWIFSISAASRERESKYTPYLPNDRIKISCPSILLNGTLSRTEYFTPTCMDRKGSNDDFEFELLFETDQEYSCMLRVDPLFKAFLDRVANGEESWNCRIPISKDSQSSFLPLALSLWGSINNGNTLFMTRLNIVVHSMEGFIISASGYSMKDHALNIKSEFPLHGSIRWFIGHTFELHSNSQPSKFTKTVYEARIPNVSDILYSVRPQILIMWILITITVTCGVCALIYVGHLKPKLLKNKNKNK